MPIFTADDVAHTRDTFLTLDDETYDGPETVMLSFGYADVWMDGEITAYGSVVFALDTDGDLVPWSYEPGTYADETVGGAS